MQKKYLLMLLLFFSHLPMYGQYENNRENVWIFGRNTGLDFNAGSPPKSIITRSYWGHFPQDFGSASVCDTSGKLLFYTDGDHVFDRNYNKMPNGSFLTPFNPVKYVQIKVNGQYISVVDSLYSYTCDNAQNALIVPFPDDVNRYYIFSLRN